MRFRFLMSLWPALLLLSACATHVMHAKSEDSASDDKMAIIDAHLHTKFSGNPNRFSKITDSRESLTKEMADNHVVGAIAHAYSDGRGWWDLKDQHVIHCAGLDKTVNVKQLDADLKSKKYRCIKVYLGYIPQYATDPHYEPAYKLAEKYNVPVVFHTGDTSDRKAWVKYSEPMAIDEVAVKYPKVKFVIAHLGNPWVETAAELVYKNENVYADISAFLVGDLSRRTPEDIEEYVVKPIRWAFHFVEDNSKLMYGTDWPLADMKSYIWAVKRAIPRDHWKDVFYNNAQAVFKIPGLPEKE